ncbi:siderophore-interacting protein [Cumulibacter manganitolerans]|uniref:siderophore-interacting protein n=1 Tax=Cumulibacter manganitolerans TaxID=1884992 RepID=UPI0012970186|nr:siderophore-interacting protein [Cumulibacter manganitolerans]
MDRTTTTYFADVVSNALLTPHMRRVVLEVHGDWASSGIADEWVRLFFPTPAGEPAVLPVSQGKGWSFPDGVPREGRWYSVRAVEGARLTIDVVVHEAGVAAEWARTATPGSRIAISGPDGRYGAEGPVDWELIVADMTGLPAALRILGELPAGRRAVAILEVQSADDEQEVVSAADVAVSWVHNPDHGHAASLLPAAVREAAWLPGAPYVWMSAEAAATRDIRSFVRREKKVPNGYADVVGYWSIKRNTAR